MELLERESSLALLAGYAAEARHGDGRLVVVGGEAGVGKTAMLGRFSGSCVMPAGPGERATACSPRARSGRCTTWPISWAASCWTCAPARRNSPLRCPIRATLADRRAGGVAAAHRVRPPPDGRDGRALPAPAQRPLGEGAPAVDRPGLPVRGRAGPAGHGRRERAAGGAEHLHRARRGRRGPADPAEAARPRRPVDPGRPQVRDPGGSARAHPARTRGYRGDLRRAEQRRDRREAVHLGQDRRPPRLRRARQARRASRNAAAAQAAKLGLLK